MSSSCATIWSNDGLQTMVGKQASVWWMEITSKHGSNAASQDFKLRNDLATTACKQ
jgi:hypothetical protein